MSRPRPHGGESGFALLLVFLMAAAIAITLYMQIPRVAFQAQRQKEQLLIERGEQYKRAIQLFVRSNGRYPGELKDLENFNNRRFLRHKFADPMTGKDDWRLVHINNGVFTDSVLNKKESLDPNQQASSTANTYVGVQPSIGEAALPGPQNANPASVRRRPSEGGPAQPAIGPDGQPVFPGQPVTGTAPGPDAETNPNANAANPVQAQPFPGGQNQGGQLFAGQLPGQPFPGGQPNPNAQPFPGVPQNSGTPVPPELANMPGLANPTGQPLPAQPFPQGVAGSPASFRQPGLFPPGAQSQSAQGPSSSYVGGNQPYVGGAQPYVGGQPYIGTTAPPTQMPNPTPFTPAPPVNAQPLPNQPVFPGNPTPPAAVNPVAPVMPGAPQGGTPGFPSVAPNPATTMIQNILTNPRPVTAGAQPAGRQIGGGIAGVASKSENPAIMVYNDRTNYNEWEFVFDYTKQQPLPNPNGIVGTPAAALGTLPGTPAGAVNAGPVAIPSAAAAVGANPNASPQPGVAGQPGQIQGTSAGGPALPPNLRPGRP